MSFLSDVFGGNSAASEAAGIQAASADRAIEEQRAARKQARGDLQPFREAGGAALPGLQSLVTDPSAQLSFIEDNPFFGALADRATDTLFSNQAARGKVGSGGTAEALQNSLLLLGNNLVGEQIGRSQNLAALGANAASGQATITQNTGNNISDLLTGQGNARAAGIIGDQNAASQGGANLLNFGTSLATLALSDVRAKTDIKPFGRSDSGIGIYTYRYKGDTEPRIGVMAQEVEETQPEAVVEISGLKHVDMGALH